MNAAPRWAAVGAAVIGAFALGRVTAPTSGHPATVASAPAADAPPPPAPRPGAPTPRANTPPAWPRPGGAAAPRPTDPSPATAPADESAPPTDAARDRPALPPPAPAIVAAFDAAMTAFAAREWATARDRFLAVYDDAGLDAALHNAAVASAELWRASGEPDDAEAAAAMYEQYAEALATIDTDVAIQAQREAVAIRRAADDATPP